ncbi:MAG: hypothetical protein RL240_1953 [Planctomycetota bacterium]|jgi:hypothetical protein
MRCPLTKRVVVYAEILDRFCGVYLFRRFGHGHGLQKLRREFRKTGILTNPTRFEQQDVIPGRFWPNAGIHGNSSRSVVGERSRCSGFQGSMCVVVTAKFKYQTHDQCRGRLRERSWGRPRPGNANRRIAIRSAHKRVPRGGECAVPEPAGL